MADAQPTTDWFADHSMSFDDMEDMITLALNSNPDDIDFSKDYVVEYQVDFNRFRRGYGRAIKCVNADELDSI